MAKGKYQEWITEDGLLIIEGWARKGLDNKQIAKNIGITQETFYQWIKRFPEFSDALKKGRKPLDVEIENALVKRAKGFIQEETVEEITENSRGDQQKHKRITHRIFPPDTAAAIFYLKNRAADRYVDRPKTPEELEAIKLDNEIKKLEIESLERARYGSEGSTYKGIPATMISPAFSQLMFDIKARKYEEFVLPGGRGSTKSSFISLAIIDLIESNPSYHAVVTRQVGNTLSTTCFTQIKWAISELGLDDEYEYTKSPMEITKKSTGQKIYFRGADDEGKFKSIKTEFGYVAILWFEELDQFHGEEATRKIEQSVIRGGNVSYIFKSFNPPRSRNNWANQYILEDYPKMHIYNSCYTEVPKEWLGEPFINRAEWIKDINPALYENEYLGIANGSGGSIFENIEARTITDAEIKTFDRFYNGVDWGWYPDPFHFIRCAYLPAQQTIYLLDEFRGNKLSNEITAKEVKKRITEGEQVICDSAELKSIEDYRKLGLKAYPAKKGPGSRELKAKWLAGQIKIVYDPKRTPISGKELISMEYERDRSGEIISGIPDGNDHAFDALGYALEPVIYKQGGGFKFLT